MSTKYHYCGDTHVTLPICYVKFQWPFLIGILCNQMSKTCLNGNLGLLKAFPGPQNLKKSNVKVCFNKWEPCNPNKCIKYSGKECTCLFVVFECFLDFICERIFLLQVGRDKCTHVEYVLSWNT
jgi:hypothetical protein